MADAERLLGLLNERLILRLHPYSGRQPERSDRPGGDQDEGDASLDLLPSRTVGKVLADDEQEEQEQTRCGQNEQEPSFGQDQALW